MSAPSSSSTDSRFQAATRVGEGKEPGSRRGSRPVSAADVSMSGYPDLVGGAALEEVSRGGGDGVAAARTEGRAGRAAKAGPDAWAVGRAARILFFVGCSGGARGGGCFSSSEGGGLGSRGVCVCVCVCF